MFLHTKEIEAESRVEAIDKAISEENEVKITGFEFIGFPRWQGITLAGFYEDEVEELSEMGHLDWSNGDQIITSIKSIKEVK